MALAFLPQLPDNRNKTFKPRTLLDSLTEYEIRKHCGIPKQEVRDLYDVIEPYIAHPTNRGHATPAETQFISAMSFFRSGSFQYVDGTVSGVSQSTVSRIIERFSRNIVNKVLPNYLRFPLEGREMNYVKSEFFNISRFPNTGGVIDGTHVNIKSPNGPEEHSFVNRRLKHSINVQVVTSLNYSFSDVVVKWPRSTHDSFMWRHSGLRDRFADGELPECWILGDSGYPLEPSLMSPVENPRTEGEKNYNQAQHSTRCIVERAIGIWKSGFRSMDHSGGSLCYGPKKCCQLIAASVFLHNYCAIDKVPLLPEDEAYLQQLDTNDDMTSPLGLLDFTSGIATRNDLIQNYFS